MQNQSSGKMRFGWNPSYRNDFLTVA